jgi:hypothetical protein
MARTKNTAASKSTATIGFRARSFGGTQFREWATAHRPDFLHRNECVNHPDVGGTVSGAKKRCTATDLRALQRLLSRHPERQTPRLSRPGSARAA